MTPGKTSAIFLFNAPTQYVIPIFQRGYVWTLEKQIAPLWADIEERALAVLEREALRDTPTFPLLAPLQKHFLGSIVLTPVVVPFGRVGSYEVIDGQQRTTTLHILMLAFKHVALANPELVALAEMLDPLLRNPGPYTESSDYFKLWPTQAGRAEIEFLGALAKVGEACTKYPSKVGRSYVDRPLMIQSFLYLHQAILGFLRGYEIDDTISEESEQVHSDRYIYSVRKEADLWAPVKQTPLDPKRAEALFLALRDCLQIMTLTLEGDDNPQVIFETLNARGEPLLASDLVRNFVFLEAMRTKLAVDDLYEQYWRQFDIEHQAKKDVTANRYWRESERHGRLTSPRIDLFFFHFTMLQSGDTTKLSHVFQNFKAWWQSSKRVIPLELQEIMTSAEHFRELLNPTGLDYLAEFGRLTKALDVSTFTPVYLYLRKTYQADQPELCAALLDVCSFVVRRAVCGFTTKGYNRLFLRLLAAMKSSSDPATALRNHLRDLKGHSQCWPSDSEFKVAWLTRPVYRELRPVKTAAIIRALEVANRTSLQETVAVPITNALTLEHVMPVSWETAGSYELTQATESNSHKPLLPSEGLKYDAARMFRNAVIHTFGNLTLVTQPLNSTVGCGPFEDTVDASGELKAGKRSTISGQSLLTLNAYFQSNDLSPWNDQRIEDRGETLFKAALKLWARPD